MLYIVHYNFTSQRNGNIQFIIFYMTTLGEKFMCRSKRVLNRIIDVEAEGVDLFPNSTKDINSALAASWITLEQRIQIWEERANMGS